MLPRNNKIYLIFARETNHTFHAGSGKVISGGDGNALRLDFRHVVSVWVRVCAWSLSPLPGEEDSVSASVPAYDLCLARLVTTLDLQSL